MTVVAVVVVVGEDMNLLSAASHEAFLFPYYRIQQGSFVARFDGKDLQGFPYYGMCRL